MKKPFLFILITVGSLTALAENPGKDLVLKKTTELVEGDGAKKLSIGLAVGMSAPLQDYKSTTSGTDTTHTVGYAKVGFHYNVTLGYKFSKFVGAMLMISGNVNAVNTSAVVSDLAGGAGGSAFGITPTGTAKASGPHYVGQYLVGPYLSVPLTKKFFIDVRALVGLTNAGYPKISGTSSYSYPGFFSYSSTIDRKTNAGIGLGYNFGAGAKYMLSEHLAATLFVDYAGSPMVYKGYSGSLSVTESTYQSSPQTYSTTTNNTNHLKMSIGMLNVSAGIAYSF